MSLIAMLKRWGKNAHVDGDQHDCCRRVAVVIARAVFRKRGLEQADLPACPRA
ncbi:hypothetical protein [Limobrevibacterium gyesilva]|uniref:hypothetical protein n=1 Tax=Limobrevibacterium gyesilva TaxID=2991712 RepID=UPI002225CAA8|nr:hypothetical protein [Limobrevibacterium gyesilva]